MTTRAIQIDFLLGGLLDTSTFTYLSGGTVEFYAAGTSTPKNVWTEREKTNPYTSITLSAAGVKHIYADGIYKIIVKDSAGSTLYTWDNIILQSPTFTLLVKTANYTGTPDDDWLIVDTDGGAVTISLEAAANFTRPLGIKNIGTSGNDVTIDPNGAETINGSSTLTLADGEQASVFSTGSAWYANNPPVASTTGKGVAQFTATCFAVTAGVVNTVRYILTYNEISEAGGGTATIAANQLYGNTIISNEGEEEAGTLYLPAMAADQSIEIFIAEPYYLRVDANGTETFAFGTTVGAAGGNIRSNTVGTHFRLTVTDGKWHITLFSGTLLMDE